MLGAASFFAMFFGVLWCIGPHTKAHMASFATQHMGLPADLSLWLHRITSRTRQSLASASESYYQPVPVEPLLAGGDISGSVETQTSREEHGIRSESLSALQSILQLTRRTVELISNQNRAKTTRRMLAIEGKRQISYDRALAVQEKRELELAKSREKWQLIADKLAAAQSSGAVSNLRMTPSQVAAWRSLQEIAARFNRGDDMGDVVLPRPVRRKGRVRGNTTDKLIGAYQRADAELVRAKKRLAEAESQVISAHRALRTIEQEISGRIRQRGEDRAKAERALDRLAEAAEQFSQTIRDRAGGDDGAISAALVIRSGAVALRRAILAPDTGLRPNP